MYNSIIWDWNGTLLNDLEICLSGVNSLLEDRSLPLLTKDRYLQIFTFPVQEYYSNAGFDFEKEPFEGPAEEFIQRYEELLPGARLFDDVEETLSFFYQNGYRQFILSAMEQRALNQSVQARGISHFFDGIFGIEDNFAKSKLSRAQNMLKITGINPNVALMIGDTLHDLEVGSAIGARVLLVSRGHQSPERLKINGNAVLPDLTTLLKFLSDNIQKPKG